jgi:hypothetical protein
MAASMRIRIEAAIECGSDTLGDTKNNFPGRSRPVPVFLNIDKDVLGIGKHIYVIFEKCEYSV